MEEDLYVPLASSAGWVVAHLAQSLDGQIATSSGASRYVTGPENLRHLHRLRALADAVVVGASTVTIDDPQLTTRLVEGRSPTRVVIDPRRRVPRARRVFEDGAAPTLVVGTDLVVPERDGELDVRAIVAALHERGLRRVLVEGGGVTVSRFLKAGVVDRLQITISPMLMGSGRRGIQLPGVERMDQVLRPRTRRFTLGEDVLFDCELRGGA